MLVLDLGCGSYCRGDVGVDINPYWKGKWHRPEFYNTYTAPKNDCYDIVIADTNYPLPFRDMVFEKVFMVHIIEHLYRPLDCLREVHRVLKPGGELIIFTPNAQVSLADWRDEGHIISFTQPTLERLLKMVFEHVETKVMEEPPFCSQDLYAKTVKTRPLSVKA